MTPEEQRVYQARQKRKNTAVAQALVAFIIVVFLITVLK